MKTIGLLGGMSWESSVGYYRAINEGWEGTAKILYEAANNVQLAGADFLLICTNTMHKELIQKSPCSGLFYTQNLKQSHIQTHGHILAHIKTFLHKRVLPIPFTNQYRLRQVPV